jgi:hypothetical protein
MNLAKQVEDMLLGKTDISALGVDNLNFMNFKMSSNNLCQVDKAKHIWNKMYKFMAGHKNDQKFSKFINSEQIKKGIEQSLQKAMAVGDVFKSFNIYKAYLIQTFLFQNIDMLKRTSKYDCNKFATMIDYITNEEVYDELKEKFLDKNRNQKIIQKNSDKKMNSNNTIQKSGFSKNKKSFNNELRKRTIISGVSSFRNNSKTGKLFISNS